MESGRRSRQTADMQAQHSRISLWPRPPVADVLVGKMRHEHSDNPRQATIMWPRLLGSLGLGQALSARGRVWAELPPYPFKPHHMLKLKIWALWSNGLLLYNTSVFLCVSNSPLGKIPRSYRVHILPPPVMIGWGQEAKEPRFIHDGNNPRSYPLCFPEQSYIFLTSPLPEAQASLPSTHSWEPSLPFLLLTTTHKRYGFERMGKTQVWKSARHEPSPFFSP